MLIRSVAQAHSYLLENLQWLTATYLQSHFRLPTANCKRTGMYSLKVLLAASIVVGNVLVVVGFCRQGRLRTSATNVYLTSLAVCDLLTGVVAIPALVVTSYIEQEMNIPPAIITCKAIISFVATFGLTTTSHLFLVSCDRYVKIKYDFTYIKYSSVERAYVICAVTWTLNAVCSFATVWITLNQFEISCDHQLFDTSLVSQIVEGTMITVLILPVILAVWMNFSVLRVATEKKRQLQANQVDQEIGVNCNQLMLSVIKEHKIALIILAINVGYLVTWPLDVMCFFVVNHGPKQWSQSFPVVQYGHPWLGLANSAFNPVILFVMHQDYRHAILSRVCNTRHVVHR